MFTEFKLDGINQKVLYVKLSNSFNMSNNSILNNKICGLYAIFSGDLCLYIGQSKNIASRLATHIKGKYASATDFYVWEAEANVLDHSEKSLMALLKPTENIMIDMDYKFDLDFAISTACALFKVSIVGDRWKAINVINDEEFKYIDASATEFSRGISDRENFPHLNKLFLDTVAPTYLPEKQFAIIRQLEQDSE